MMIFKKLGGNSQDLNNNYLLFLWKRHNKQSRCLELDQKNQSLSQINFFLKRSAIILRNQSCLYIRPAVCRQFLCKKNMFGGQETKPKIEFHTLRFKGLHLWTRDICRLCSKKYLTFLRRRFWWKWSMKPNKHRKQHTEELEMFTKLYEEYKCKRWTVANYKFIRFKKTKKKSNRWATLRFSGKWWQTSCAWTVLGCRHIDPHILPKKTRLHKKKQEYHKSAKFIRCVNRLVYKII